ncbi:hypothetical protein BV25DRAFT_1793493 [Artomyces pyxidatus]|uniref:Uncharacterized protein n=1 Tax=Artomyces pyxidatus TaxID=48021 RepID=A0ACB8TIX5_9AGAM|nr:hypothetical protein BV25DRAFT_1793493 [Artomyces pyxidatus]
MPDLEVDLVDQFICPPCVAKDPHLNLRTTWKRRCLYGQKQSHPNSPSACHRPARGAFSKYCSDECGVKYMQMRITYWAERGGDRERLWENVKNAERVEGVVVSAKLAQEHCNRSVDMDVDGAEAKPVSKHGIPGLVKPKKPKADREMERLQAQLDTVVHSREMMKKELDIVVWREKLTELAVRRSEAVDACGWDQRLCFGDEEVADFGTGVLESYEEMGREGDAMHVDGEGEWWCQGKRKCERHAGWQKLRIAEVQFEKEMKEQALLKLTTHEREIRKRVEDIVDPQGLHASATNTTFASPPRLDPGERKPAANGHSKLKPNGESKKGKKRKAEIM